MAQSPLLGPYLFSHIRRVTAIDPERVKPLRARTFHPGEEPAMLSWFHECEGRNFYWNHNRPKADLTSKAEKADIEFVDFLHVDLDPRAGEDLLAERARILALLSSAALPPTIIVDSGNGYPQGTRRRRGLRLGPD